MVEVSPIELEGYAKALALEERYVVVVLVVLLWVPLEACDVLE